MLATVVLVVVAAIAALLIYAATRPDSFRLERSTRIKAPAKTIFPLINDFKHWPAWSPWENKDPAMKRTHSGAAEGRGAVYAWEGNKNVGQGSMDRMVGKDFEAGLAKMRAEAEKAGSG